VGVAAAYSTAYSVIRQHVTQPTTAVTVMTCLQEAAVLCNTVLLQRVGSHVHAAVAELTAAIGTTFHRQSTPLVDKQKAECTGVARGHVSAEYTLPHTLTKHVAHTSTL
jgi:hypothetical protein